MAGFLVQGKRVAIASAVLASIYCGLGAVVGIPVLAGNRNPLFARGPLAWHLGITLTFFL